MNTTVRIKASQIYKDWHVIDAAGRPLGRVASEAAILLRGKHKPTYEPHLDDGDFVIVINAGQVKVTGRKAEQIKYHRHSGYPGGLRTRTFVEEFTRYPERVIERAVWGMLPGGTLGEAMLKHLKVYKGAHHPHQSQITGSERARAARAEALAASIGAPMRPARLRKLSVPVVVEAAQPKPAPAAEKPEPKPKRGKAAPTEATVAATEAAAEAVEATSGVVTTTGETPAEAAVAAEKKPRRSKAAAESAATAEAPAGEATAEAPKPRTRRKAAEPAADASDATPKPARKRAAPKTEE